MNDAQLAREALAHCQAIARFSDESGAIARTFLSEAMRACYSYLSRWMQRLGMQIELDAAGNLRGLYSGRQADRRSILIGSHLDTVRNAGPYDGVLGVVIAISLIELLDGEHLPFAIEVIGFSEEEGVRFGLPFIGSRALAGTLDERTLQIRDASGVSIEQAIRSFGLDTARLPQAELRPETRAYLEFHIEQGPVLDSIGAPLGVVESVAGQSRASVTFRGTANHAGTTPMRLRHDALCGAAEWISCVEKHARSTQALVATVGQIEAKPGISNAIPGEVSATLDIRHPLDCKRRTAFETLLANGNEIARQRGLTFQSTVVVDQDGVPMDAELTNMAAEAIRAVAHRAGGARCARFGGQTPHRMSSGAGHDAMIIAPKAPSAMIFLRSPGGISHHPDETVEQQDVTLALRAGLHLLRKLSTCSFLS